MLRFLIKIRSVLWKGVATLSARESGNLTDCFPIKAGSPNLFVFVTAVNVDLDRGTAITPTAFILLRQIPLSQRETTRFFF